MLLVIFGAGASYDCVGDYQQYGIAPHDRLPLANELFAPSPRTTPVLSAYPDAQPIAARIRSRGAQVDVEKELGEVADEAATDPDRFRHLMGVRLYLQHLISDLADGVRKRTASADNYAALVERLRTWRKQAGSEVACVSFNYDDLLERTIAASFRVRIEYPDDYVAAPIRVFKPHGSINWIRRLVPRTGLRPGHRPTLLADAADLIETDTFEARSAPRLHDPRVAWAPGLAVPLADKSEFACPREHLTMLDQLVPEVDRLLIVGWRGREPHFRSVLERCTTAGLRTLVVAESQPAASATVVNLPPAVQRRMVTAGTGFSGLLPSPELAAFLR